MTKIARLKPSRRTEARKLDLAKKYADRGVTTGEGRIGSKKLRRTTEARFVPMLQTVEKLGNALG